MDGWGVPFKCECHHAEDGGGHKSVENEELQVAVIEIGRQIASDLFRQADPEGDG